MNTPFNQLTDAQAERLAILAEEAGEVIQAVGKVLRHGYDSKHPNSGITNLETLEKEIGDFLCCAALLARQQDISWTHVMDESAKKDNNLGRYTHHQPKECGCSH